MATGALSLAAISIGLHQYNGRPSYKWLPGDSDDRKAFLNIYNANIEAYLAQARRDRLSGLASHKTQDLENFFSEQSVRIRFKKPLNGIGVSSLFVGKADPPITETVNQVVIRVPDQVSGGFVPYAALELPPDLTKVYEVSGYAHPLIRFASFGNYTLWMTIAEEPLSGLRLALQAESLQQASRRLRTRGNLGVTVPQFSFCKWVAQPWLFGMRVYSKELYVHQRIIGAYQLINLSLQSDRFLSVVDGGTTFKIATSGSALDHDPNEPRPIVFDRPLLVTVTPKKRNNLVVATGYIDYDSWRIPRLGM